MLLLSLANLGDQAGTENLVTSHWLTPLDWYPGHLCLSTVRCGEYSSFMLAHGPVSLTADKCERKTRRLIHGRATD